MKKKSKPMKPQLQILLGIGLIIWGAGSLIYQMQPGVIGLKSIPIIMLIAGVFNLYVGIKRTKTPAKDALAHTQQEANELAFLEKVDTDSKAQQNGKEDCYEFLVRTYEKWRDGYFETLGAYYKNAASNDSPSSLAEQFLTDAKHYQFLASCFNVRVPEADEVMYTIIPNDFMLTNSYLYLASDLKQSKLYTIPICEIIAYTNKGVWNKSGIIKLKNDTEIRFKLGAVPDEKKLRQLQIMRNCDQAIAIL